MDGWHGADVGGVWWEVSHQPLQEPFHNSVKLQRKCYLIDFLHCGGVEHGGGESSEGSEGGAEGGGDVTQVVWGDR